MMCRTSITRLRETRCGALVAAVLAATLLAGCDDPPGDPGPVRSESRNVGEFHSINIRGAASGTIRVGAATSLALTGGERTLENISTEVRDGRLIVDAKKGWLWNHGEVNLDITVPVLREATISGAGNLDIQNAQGDALELAVNGAGNIVATGEIQSLTVHINGAGDAVLAGLRARDARVVVNGTGNVTVNAADALSADVNGVGSVRHVGKPGTLQTRVNGVGRVTQLPALEAP
jgi:hypothetical protein